MTFYFTFGHGQPHFGKFHKIEAADWAEARAKMIERFGTKWSMQYTEDRWIKGDGTTQADIYNLEELL